MTTISKITLLSLSFFLVLLMSMNACSPKKTRSSGSKKTTNDGINADTGATVYQKYCFACHGKDGQLNLGGATNLAFSTIPKSDAIQQIKKGKGMMQAYENKLSNAEIDAVADYILTLRKN